MTAYQRTQILLEPEQHSAMTIVAAEQQRSLSELMRELIADFLAKKDKERKRQEALMAIEQMAKFREELAARITEPMLDPVDVKNELWDERMQDFERIWRGEE